MTINTEKITDTLLKFAREKGVGDVKLISPFEIVIEEKFRLNCEEPKCPGFGQSPSCPPYSILPNEFIEMLKSYSKVLVFKFDVPIGIFETDEKNEVARLIHETSAAIEQKARAFGCLRAKGFAGGSCKIVFCEDYTDCAELKEQGTCRYPDFAKVSLSGLGVNFYLLAKKLGWQMMKDEEGNKIESETAMMVGMVLLD